MADRYVALDWSAANRPVSGADSVWLAVADDGHGEARLANPTTRSAAMHQLRTDLVEWVSSGDRVVVGIDAGFGYPEGTAAALGLGSPGWSSMWSLLTDLVDDDDHNRSNRFEVAAKLNRRFGGPPGPFWGCPTATAGPDLATRRGPMPFEVAGRRLAEYRRVEEHLRARGRLAQSVWKLYTAGSVGSQTLLAIARLELLRRDPSLHGRVRIWPFEVTSADDLAAPGVIVAEVWPALADPPGTPGVVRDADQVRAVVRWLAELRRSGRLDELLLLTDLDADDRRVARAEEGWILGAETV